MQSLLQPDPSRPVPHPTRSPLHCPPVPRGFRGGGSCSLPTASGFWCWPPLTLRLFCSPSPSCYSLFGKHSPSCSQTHVQAPVRLSHQRDLGMPEPGCCQRRSGQGTQRWQPSPQAAAGLAPWLAGRRDGEQGGRQPPACSHGMLLAPQVDCYPTVNDTIYSYGALTLDGDEYIPFERYKGKTVLFVNVATY